MVSLSQLLAPPDMMLSSGSPGTPGARRGGTGRPAGSPLVRRLLECLTGDAYSLGQLAAVLMSSSGGSRGVDI